MFWRKPPPPPKPKIPQWVSVVTPIIFAVIAALAGLVYTSMAEEIKNVKESVEKVEQKKVDNQVLKLMIEKDRQALQTQQERNKEQDKAIIENQRAIQQLLIRSPKNLVIKRQVDNKKVLPPELFEKYITMKPEIQEKYKLYLEKKGYDVSQLP
jgi:hypothetical protein